MAGGGISLKLQPNMRIVIELAANSAAGNEAQAQPLTLDACKQLSHAAISAARAAEAAVVSGR